MNNKIVIQNIFSNVSKKQLNIFKLIKKVKGEIDLVLWDNEAYQLIKAVGVRKAIDVFFKSKPEIILTLSGTQCLIVKL